MLKVIDMMLGELEYTRFFVDQTPPMPVLSRLAFLAFCIMIPIVLMNLLVRDAFSSSVLEGVPFLDVFHTRFSF